MPGVMNEMARRWTIGSAVFLTIIGMGLSIAAILTPSWQVVNLREYNAIHEHGLWLDCIRHTRDGNVILRRYTTITEPLHCVYKFDYDKYSGTFSLEDDNSPVGEVNRHKWYGWHIATLILLTLALITSFSSACIGTCGCCYASLSLVFTAITLLTIFLSSVAVGVFFFFSHRADNRFIKGIVGTYEQRVGLAFFLQMAACFFHFISFIISMLATYFAFTSNGAKLDRYSLQTTSKTNITNMGRQQQQQRQLGSSRSLNRASQFSLNHGGGGIAAEGPAEAFPLLQSGMIDNGGSSSRMGVMGPGTAPPSFHSRSGSNTLELRETPPVVAASTGFFVDNAAWLASEKRPPNFASPPPLSPPPPFPAYPPPDPTALTVEQALAEIETFRASQEFINGSSGGGAHPVFVQQPKPMRMPPAFHRVGGGGMESDFDRAVADSMPELAGGPGSARAQPPHFSSSELLPGRVRRKSETCV